MIWLLLLVLIFLGLSLFAFWTVVRPPKIVSGWKPDDFELPFEAHTARTADGHSIGLWLIPRRDGGAKAPEQRPVVLLLHGYPAEKGDLLPIAARLHPEFDVLLLDFRSFGESSGTVTTVGAKEVLDVRAALDFLAERGYTRVGLFGFSLGGAVALRTAAVDPRVSAVVSLESFSDLLTIGADAYRFFGPLRRPFVSLVALWARVFLGINAAEVSPVRAAAQLAVPVLLIHAEGDEEIPVAHGRRIAASLSHNPNAEIIFFPGGSLHGALPEDVWERLIHFLEKISR